MTASLLLICGATRMEVSKIKDPILRAALDYWLNARGDSDIPLRSHIDPVTMPPEILPYLVLAEYLNPEGRVRFRLVGGKMEERWGHNFSGQTSDEIFSGSYREFLESLFETAYSSRIPVYSESVFRWDAGGFQRTERIMMPICFEIDGPPTQVLIVQNWPDDGQWDIKPTKSLISGEGQHKSSVLDLA